MPKSDTDAAESNTSESDNAEVTDLSVKQSDNTSEKKSDAVTSQNRTRRKPPSRRGSRSKPRDNTPDQISDIDSKDLVKASELEEKSLEDLSAIAQEMGMNGMNVARKDEVVYRLLRAYAERDGSVISNGVLETLDDGYGFLRRRNLRPSLNDIYVSQSQIRRFGLRTGDMITGHIRPPKSGEKYHGLLRVDNINSLDPETARRRSNFDGNTAEFPDQLIDLETDPKNLSMRLMNMVAPVGRGQRGLIVSPPKAGKTTVLKQIANAITAKYDDIHIMVVLIGERPEEVTDMQRNIQGEVVHSTFDEPVEEHGRVAEMAMERAKRLVEVGQHVVLLLDCLTRLTRAYNLSSPSSGRTLSGGMDPVALYPAKRFFGAARNTAEGGSLTIMATALVDTGSRADEVIFEEFKGTGNSELVLDRKLSDRRLFPAFDIVRSGTRKEELLLSRKELGRMWILRKLLNEMKVEEAMEFMLDRIKRTKTNTEFLDTMSQ